MLPGTLRSFFAAVVLLSGVCWAAETEAPSDPSTDSASAIDSASATDPTREEASRQAIARREAIEAFRNGGVDAQNAQEPFPWIPLVLSGVVLAAAYPFARSFFRSTAAELTGEDR